MIVFDYTMDPFMIGLLCGVFAVGAGVLGISKWFDKLMKDIGDYLYKVNPFRAKGKRGFILADEVPYWGKTKDRFDEWMIETAERIYNNDN